MERFIDLDTSLSRSWDLMLRAALGRNDAMRTPVLATFDGQKIHQRTIVLRKVDVQKRCIYFFSDYRAPKIQHLLHDSQLNAVFYSPKKKVQIEAGGRGQIFRQDEQCRSFWQQINTGGRKSYATAAVPGSTHFSDKDYLSAKWSDEAADPSGTDWAFENFALIVMEIKELDVLHLHQEGHQRAYFYWNDGKWNGSWLVP